MGRLKKKGDIDTTVFLWAFTLILLAFVVVTLVLFIEDSANNTGFKKSFITRDIAVLVNTLYLSPGDAFISYQINEGGYRIGIGKFEDGYFVKAGYENELLLRKYRYVEDGYKEQIMAKTGMLYDIKGLMMIKTNDGISIMDIGLDSDEKIEKAEEGIFKKAFSSKKAEKSSIEKIKEAKEIARRLNAAWPVESKQSVVTDCYGNSDNREGIKSCGKEHCGIDIRADESTNVVSAISGEVDAIKNNIGMVSIKSDDIIMNYIHLSKIDVKVGQAVSKNQIIGKAGNKGNAGKTDNAAHLHFAAIVNGYYFDPLEIGIFNPKELSFKAASNCFTNSYSYEMGEKVE